MNGGGGWFPNAVVLLILVGCIVTIVRALRNSQG
jgi:hypothetical protein